MKPEGVLEWTSLEVLSSLTPVLFHIIILHGRVVAVCAAISTSTSLSAASIEARTRGFQRFSNPRLCGLHKPQLRRLFFVCFLIDRYPTFDLITDPAFGYFYFYNWYGLGGKVNYNRWPGKNHSGLFNYWAQMFATTDSKSS
jgi:hypothetical protein